MLRHHEKGACEEVCKKDKKGADDGADGKRKPPAHGQLAEKRVQWVWDEKPHQQPHVLLDGAGCAGVHFPEQGADCQCLREGAGRGGQWQGIRQAAGRPGDGPV